MKITFHWVWAAINESMDNTYFLIEDWDNKLQVDCGWWLWLMQKVKRKEINFNNLFITHKHTDHLLWFFKFARDVKDWWNIEKLKVYCSLDVEKTILKVVDVMEINWIKKAINNWNIVFDNISDSENLKLDSFEITPINLNSNKIEQYWFFLKNNKKNILFFWDEAVKILDREDLKEFYWADYLICEALNPEDMDVEYGWIINNKKICHITSREAWKIANKLKVKNLILIHTWENIPWWRVEELKKDASREFNWNIIVPNEWDILDLK